MSGEGRQILVGSRASSAFASCKPHSERQLGQQANKHTIPIWPIIVMGMFHETTSVPCGAEAACFLFHHLGPTSWRLHAELRDPGMGTS